MRFGLGPFLAHPSLVQARPSTSHQYHFTDHCHRPDGLTLYNSQQDYASRQDDATDVFVHVLPAHRAARQAPCYLPAGLLQHQLRAALAQHRMPAGQQQNAAWSIQAHQAMLQRKQLLCCVLQPCGLAAECTAAADLICGSLCSCCCITACGCCCCCCCQQPC